MPMVLTDSGPIFFVHVPKTAGTSIEDYLVRRFGPLILTDINKRERTAGTGLISPITHLSAIDLREIIPSQSILVFTMVRDPLSRLVSEYRWQSGASWMSRMSFSTWLRVMVGCVRIDARAYRNHIRPQTDLVPEDVEVFRFEDGFDAIIARIDEVTGISRPDLSMGHFKDRRGRRAEPEIFREDVDLVRRFYTQDYNRFGYSEPDVSNLPQDRRAVLRDLLGAILARIVIWKQRRDWLR